MYVRVYLYRHFTLFVSKDLYVPLLYHYGCAIPGKVNGFCNLLGQWFENKIPSLKTENENSLSFVVTNVVNGVATF